MKMKKNILRLLSTLLLLFFNNFLFADIPGVPQPPGGGSVGGATGTPGAPASPIDMYIPLLIVLAILVIVWYVRKRRIQIQ